MMSKERGKFIVIEGPDGTGKSTQTELLHNKLIEVGYKVEKFDFPQYETTFFGNFVGRYLNEEFGKLNEVDPHLASMLFAADRMQAKPFINKLLEEGKTVLSNRYRFSNIAHQAARIPEDRREKFIEFLNEMELNIFDIPREDINIILHISPEKARELIDQKPKRSYLTGGKKFDIQEQDLAYQIEVARIYEDLPLKNENIIGINCEKNNSIMTPDEIHNLVWKEVSTRLDLHDEGKIIRERQS